MKVVLFTANAVLIAFSSSTAQAECLYGGNEVQNSSEIVGGAVAGNRDCESLIIKTIRKRVPALRVANYFVVHRDLWNHYIFDNGNADCVISAPFGKANLYCSLNNEGRLIVVINGTRRNL